MEPFIGLGLKAADTVIDKHFHKIPDKYVHPATYKPQNLIPKKLKKSNGSRRNSEDATENSDNESKIPLQDIPTHSGALSPQNTRFSETGIPMNSKGSSSQPPGAQYAVPSLYSQQQPKFRPQYIPPPPRDGIYPPSPPPSAAATQLPPHESSQFPPQVPNFNCNQHYDDSIASSRRRKTRGSYETSPDQTTSTYDDGISDTRRSRVSRRPPVMTRRSSSYQTPRKRSYDDVRDGASDTFRTRRPKAPARRSSSYQAPRGRSEYGSDSESESDRTEVRRSNALVRREKSRSRHDERGVVSHQRDSDSEGVSRQDEKIITISGSRSASRRELRTYNRYRDGGSDSDRRSSSYYPPRTRYQPSPPSSSSSHHRPSPQSHSNANTKSRDYQRRASLSSHNTISRPNTAGSKGDLFTSSKAGLTGGAVGALIGGWAAQKAHVNYRDGDKGDGGGHTVMTLLGAAMGGLAVNAVVEKVEERKSRKEGFGDELGRRGSGRRRSVAEVRMGGRRRVEDWDDGYGNGDSGD
ncbi:hypothetical protein BGZ60DRAFT_436419 [Tricladium varicosporioides]|nr:hypothetical protein BGZ60DRAFT_436419 [Hymenoscyphus varicosporioides]